MSQPTGFSTPLSLPRRLMVDYLHHARKVPSVPVEMRMNLAVVAEARDRAVPRPGWCSLFTKAWAIVCDRHPQLRRAYLAWPWARLYQHPISVATIAVERPFQAEDAVFFAHMNSPEKKSLLEIDQRLQWFKDRPLGDAGTVRRQLKIAALPTLLRRPLWWMMLHLDGRLRARFFGTFGVTAYAGGGGGAESLHPPGLMTTTLSYGTVHENGNVTVRVTYDHRTLDGGPISRALGELERVLQHEILAELRYLEGVEVRHAA